MDAATVADLFDQIIGGEDIPKIGYLLQRMSPETASRTVPGWPYSVLTNLAHADFWQQIWLARLEGKPRPKFRDDWRVPEPEEFEPVRSSFLTNLKRARQMVADWPLGHDLESDDKALHMLVSLAVHDAYHIGQIKLMARILDEGRTKQGKARTERQKTPVK
ncbi:MAG: DinB family protein [Armatimonadetes bacterium]|nr:DinB family protein [Armatimonadota bacterium]